MYTSSVFIKSGVDTSVLITIEMYKTTVSVDSAVYREHKSYSIPWGISRIMDNIEKSGFSKQSLQEILCSGHTGDETERHLLNVQFSSLFYQIHNYIAPFLSNSQKVRIKIAGCLFSEIKSCCQLCLKDYDGKMLVNVLPPVTC